MKLHESLAELARDHGHDLFRDASAFRGSLDDYLDEGQASSGTINLLTDAVRLGALDAMVTMLDSGANAADAVESAGQRLARDRGSADVRGCQWAVSVLGFALGKVPEALVSGLDPDAGTTAPPNYGPGGTAPTPGMSPVRPPQQPIVSPTAPVQSPPHPIQSPPAGVHHPGPAVSPTPGYSGGGYGGGAASYPGGGWSQPTPPKKSKTGLVITAAVVAVLLIAGGIIGVIALTGDDGDKDKKSDQKKEQKKEETLDGPTIEGLGYEVTVPKGWQDDTEGFKTANPGDTGSLDKVLIWGDTFSSSRGNVIIETQNAYGETDPNGLKGNWKNALVQGDSSAETVDIDSTRIDGQSALGVEIARTNSSGVEVTQRSHLVISGDKAYSITVSLKKDDDKVLEEFERILENGWKWAADE